MVVELNPGLSITLIDGKSTLLINQDNFPNTKAKFKQFFMCEREPIKPKQKEQV